MKEQRRRPRISLGDALRRRSGDPRDQKLQIYVDMATYEAIVRHKIRTGRPASAFLAEMIAEALRREEEAAREGALRHLEVVESVPQATHMEQEPQPTLPAGWARRADEEGNDRKYLGRLKNGRKSAWADIRKNRERWAEADEEGRERIRASVAHMAERLAGWQSMIDIVEPALGFSRSWYPADVVEFVAGELGIDLGPSPATAEEHAQGERPGLLSAGGDTAEEEPEPLDDEEI